MRSVQIERSTQSHSCGRMSPVCLAELHTGTGLASSERDITHPPSCAPLWCPPALPGFSATMGALTPVRPAYRRPCVGQVSLVHTARPSLHFRHQPPNAWLAIAFSMPSQRDGLPGALTFASSAIQSASRSGSSHTASRLVATPGRIVFVILRTTGSFTVALHPASRQRSYFQLPGKGISRKRTFTSSIAPASRRTRRQAFQPVQIKRRSR